MSRVGAGFKIPASPTAVGQTKIYLNSGNDSDLGSEKMTTA